MPAYRTRPLPGRAEGRPPHHRCGGVTLVELMITLSVLVIMTTIGVPSMTSVIHNNRVAITANDLTLALTLARSEAIRRGATMRVCASSDGVDCDIVNPNDCHADWSVGWLVLPAATGDAVRVQNAVAGGIGPAEQSGAPWVSFDALGAAGFPACVSATSVAFNIGDAANAALRQRRLELMPSGRVSLESL
jgi:type IV fimbrial biogenesis protein FimT